MTGLGEISVKYIGIDHHPSRGSAAPYDSHE